MKYEKPEAKVILFNNGDVVTSSAYDPEDPNGFCLKQGNSHHQNCYNGKKPYGWKNYTNTVEAQTYANYWSEW